MELKIVVSQRDVSEDEMDFTVGFGNNLKMQGNQERMHELNHSTLIPCC